jgi:hypothetical protein
MAHMLPIDYCILFDVTNVTADIELLFHFGRIDNLVMLRKSYQNLHIGRHIV